MNEVYIIEYFIPKKSRYDQIADIITIEDYAFSTIEKAREMLVSKGYKLVDTIEFKSKSFEEVWSYKLTFDGEKDVVTYMRAYIRKKKVI